MQLQPVPKKLTRIPKEFFDNIPEPDPDAELLDKIVEHQRERIYCIKSQQRIDRATDAFLAPLLGYRPDHDAEERTKIFALTGKARKAVEKSNPEQLPEIAQADLVEFLDYSELILDAAAARKPFDKRRARCEEEMKSLASQLPFAHFTDSVVGLSHLGLAVIVAEAAGFDIDEDGIRKRRAISDYRTVSGLWHRLGFAVLDGQRQRRIKGDKDSAIEHGYSPQRHAQVWSFLCSWRPFVHWHVAKGFVPQTRYGELFVRAYYNGIAKIELTQNMPAAFRWRKSRALKHAGRVMAKEVLKDLYVEARRVSAITSN